jgi:hypothetical protein
MKRTQAFLLLLLILLFGLTSKLLVTPTNYPNSDFFSFWLAGRMVHTGQNPYVEEGWVRAHQVYGAEWISDPTFLYPIPLAIFFIPFGLLDLYDAFVLWVWLSLVLLLVSVVMLLPLFGSVRKHFILPVALGILLYRPALPLLLNGQLAAFFFLLLVVTGVFWEKGHWTWGGVIVSFLALKPNIGVPILGLISLYLLVHKYYKGLLGMGLGLIGMWALGGLYVANWVELYLGVLQAKHAQTFGFSATIWGLSAFVSRFNHEVTLVIGSVAVLFVSILFFVLITRPKAITPMVALALSVSAGLLVTPYLWPYDQVLLFLPIILIMAFLRKAYPYLGIALVFIVIDVIGWVLFSFSINIQMENLNALLTLTVLALQSYSIFQDRITPVPEPV